MLLIDIQEGRINFDEGVSSRDLQRSIPYPLNGLERNPGSILERSEAG